ncbi:MAG: hypothetical protein GY696_39980 [Gammaproteobacteria bacterium]|nr:hypothetical protein [Gammaproteobacteria bacterium]
MDLDSFGRECVTLWGNWCSSLGLGFPLSKLALDFHMPISTHKTEFFEALCVGFQGRIFSTAACYLQGVRVLGCVFWSAILSTFGAQVLQGWGQLFTINVHAYIGTVHFDSNHTSGYLLYCRQPDILLLAATWAHQKIQYDKPANFSSFSVGVKVVEWDDDGFVGGKLRLPSCRF